MATVTVVTAAKSAEIENALIDAATVNSAGHLILTKKDGGTIDAGRITDVLKYDGASYTGAESAFSYVGDIDPGAVAEGSVWYDTSVTRQPELIRSAYDIQNDELYAGTAPTISTVETTTPTTGYIKQAPAPVSLSGTDVRGAFSFLGAGDFQIGATSPDTNYVRPLSRYPNTYASGQSTWSVQFSTDADIIQIKFKYISTSTMYRLHINGRKVTDYMQSVNGSTAGFGHLMTIDFGSFEPRNIRLDFVTCPFGGIYIPPTATLWSHPSTGGRFMGYGDSLTDGSSKNTGGGQGTWLMRASRLLGYRDVWNQSRGSTGYISAGSHVVFGDRLDADCINLSPDVLVIWGGYNDSAGDQLAIRAAVDNVFGRVVSGLPNCRTMAIGCWSNVAAPGAGITDTDTTIKDAAAAAGIPFVSPVTGKIYDAYGIEIDDHGPWITSGNVDTFIGNITDTVHPTDAGHDYLARRVAAALMAAKVA